MEKRNHVAVWKCIQLFGRNAIFHRRRVTAFLVDETYIRIGEYEAWVWVAIEPIHRYILGMYIPVEAEEHHGCRALSKNPCQDVWYTCGIFR
ncbi:MAG: hypothetical protein QXX17_05725 [Conexivisphaerales archaeon]